MIEQTDLYDLIHSLSGSEKRYISLSMREKGEKNHLKLFRAIEKQKKFNETELQELLRKEDFIQRLPYLKHYLQGYILKTLNSYHYTSTTGTILKQSILEAEILLKKNLVTQARKKIERIIRIANEEEEFEILLQCIKLERSVLIRTRNNKTFLRDLNALSKRGELLIRKISDENLYLGLIDQLGIFLETLGVVRTKSQKEKIKKWLRHPLLNDKVKLHSKKSEYAYSHLRSLCYYLLDDAENALKSNENVLILLEPKIYVNLQSLQQYTQALGNKIVYLVQLKKYQTALSPIEKMRVIAENAKNNRNFPEKIIHDILSRSYNQEMGLYLLSAQYQKALEIIPTVEKHIKNYGNKIQAHMQLDFYYSFSYIHFIYGNYKQTLLYLNKILNRGKNEIPLRQDINCFSRILFLLTQYEIQKGNLSESFIRSTYNFLVHRNPEYKIENIFMRFMLRKLFKNQGPDELKQQLLLLKKELILLKESPYGKKTLEELDFISWIESKIRKKPLIEILNASKQ